MAFDECTPYPCGKPDAEASMRLSMRWAARCRARWKEMRDGPGALFGINQGSVYPDLRAQSVDALLELDFPGLAVGGLSVGEPKEAMHETLAKHCPENSGEAAAIPHGRRNSSRYRPWCRSGIDMFDCVLPTRNARNGCLLPARAAF